MTREEFLKLQIGMFITDHQDTNDSSNYCRIEGFEGRKIRLQPYERHGVPAHAHSFTLDYSEVNITEKLFPSEYYSLSRR